jgi:hypothetical protein
MGIESFEYTYMQIQNLNFPDAIAFLSFIACIAGLILLSGANSAQVNELEETEQNLLRMSFTYWLVYCICLGLQKMTVPDWETLWLSLKLTAALSYFLTFACILCLPLHRFAVRQVDN